MLDPEARASGLTVQVGGRAVTSALPIEVASGAHVAPMGIAAADCNGVTGTWRSLVWSEPHQAYYDFTLKVRQPSPKSPALEGTVLAHSFTAPLGTPAPPADCLEEWTVEEPATGRVNSDGTMRFDGTSWRVADTVCGDAPQSYSHDQFQITPASTGIVFDAKVWVNGLDAKFTRTSCD